MINQEFLEAATKGKLKKLQEALKNSADINCVNEKGETALHLTVEGWNSEEILSELLGNAECDIYKKDGYGRTAFEKLLKPWLSEKIIFHYVLIFLRKRPELLLDVQKGKNTFFKSIGTNFITRFLVQKNPKLLQNTFEIESGYPLTPLLYVVVKNMLDIAEQFF